MGTDRIPKEAGWAGRLPKGPNGRNLCRNCQKEVQGRRITFCSDECVHEWKLRTNPVYQARHVLERDNGVCALCGLDCVILLQELRKLRSVERSGARLEDLGKFSTRCEELELPAHLRALVRRLWEMDHTVPVVEGGGGCGLDNLRTLCWKCHRGVTRELRARRKKKRV